MKKLVASVFFLLLTMAFLPLYGQLGLSLMFNRKRYMIYEQVYACLTIRNDTGKPLLFGNSPALTGFIMFDIRDSNNRLIFPRKGRAIATSGLYLAPGEVRSMVINLQDYYDLGKEGRYVVHAYVSHNQLRNEYRTKSTTIMVSEGSEVWRRTVGLPDRTGKNENKEVERTYSIYKMEGDQKKFYYLRVEDDGKIYAMTRIGVVYSHRKFEAQVDMLSRIHLLMPEAPRVFHYMLFNADGVCLENSYWKTVGTVPGLFRDPKTGKVERLGGERARKGVDFIDPTENSVSASDLMNKNTRKKPDKASGIVDLGEGLMPVKSADED